MLLDLTIGSAPEIDQKRFKMGIDMFNQGLMNGEIRNVDFQNAKSWIGAGLSVIFDDLQDTIRPMKKSFSEDQYDLLYYSHVDSIASLKAFGNKIKKGEWVPAVFHEFVQKYSPLIQAMDDLKPLVVKGRATGTKKVENPHKISLTCPCCIRKIAIDQRNTIVHHGYRRPGWGSIQGDCPGTGFKPLEISNEGLKYMLKTYKNAVNDYEKQLNNRDKIEEIVVHGYSGQKTVLTKDAPKFKSALQQYINQLESDRDWTLKSIEKTQARLAAWKPNPEVVAFLKNRTNGR